MPLMSSDSLELNGDALKRLDYHWFWGLWYNTKAATPTLFSVAVERLLVDEALRAQIRTSQDALHRHTPIVQFFYWLFNINNYTYHAYVLAAYETHQRHVNREARRPLMEAPANVSYAWARQRLLDVLIYVQHITGIRFTPTAAPQAMPPAVSTIDPQENNNPTIRVTALMLPHLAALDLMQEAGAELSIKAFKLACRRKFLSTHPDKGGSAEDFCSVSTAIETLTRLISSPNSVLLADVLAALMVEVDKLKADMAANRATAAAAITALQTSAAADRATAAADRATAATARATAAADRAVYGAEFARLEAMIIAMFGDPPSPPTAAALSAQGLFPSAGEFEGAPSSASPRPS